MSFTAKLAVLPPLGALVLLLAPMPDEPARPKPDAGMFEVRLADGSVVKMHILTEQLDVTTRYGRLQVPVAEVRRIEVGFRYPEGVEKRVEAAVARLGNADFKVREAAAAELLALKELAYPALKRAVQSDDQEVKRRAADLIRGFEEKLPAEKLRQRDHDLILTTHFPIAGRIEGLSLKGRSTVFGEVQLQLAELRQVRSLIGGSEVEVSVDAARYAAPSNDQWLETEIEVDKGTTVKIRAEGTINLNPNGGNFQAGPDGNNQWGQNGMFPVGALIGRFGRTGKQFLLGSRYDGEASATGKIYLRIAPSPWGNVPAGSYEVKVSIDPWGGTLPTSDAGPARRPIPRKAPGFKVPEFKKEEKKAG
jgi:hypothetical protein